LLEDFGGGKNGVWLKCFSRNHRTDYRDLIYLFEILSPEKDKIEIQRPTLNG